MDESRTVTMEMGRSSSRAMRSAPATSAAFSPGSTKSSMAPLQPKPQPQTASADVADELALLRDEEAGTGAPVGRPSDGHDGGQGHPLSTGVQRFDRPEDVADLAHRSRLAALDGYPVTAANRAGSASNRSRQPAEQK